VSAKERLANAFWDMFAEMPYREITIASISKRAAVSHNTFYYYYQNLEDMAVVLLEENFIPNFPAFVLESFASGTLDTDNLVLDPLIRKRFGRMCILVGKNSETWIMERLKEATMNLWYTALDLDPARLKKGQQAQLVFLLGGILAVLGEYGQSGDPAEVKELIGLDLGKALLPIVSGLREIQA